MCALKASVKYLEGTKWKQLDAKECIGKSIAHIMSTSDKVMIGAILDEENKPVFFLTNNKEQFDKYKDKAYTMMVDDLILLLGSETIPSIPLVTACLNVFPNGTFESITDERLPDDKTKWW